MCRFVLGRLTLLDLALLHASLSAEELRIALFDVAPYSYRDEAGELSGLYVSQAMQLARLVQREAHIELTSFARRSLLISQGQADLTIGFETAELKSGAIALGPVARVDSIVLLRAGLDSKRLQGLRLGRIRGGCSDLQASMPELEFHELNHYQSGLQMLINRRLDGLCGTQDALDYSATQEAISLDGLQRLSVTKGREVWVFVSRKTSATLQSELAQAVEKITTRTGSGPN